MPKMTKQFTTAREDSPQQCFIIIIITQVYIEDALGDRVWVDLAGCQSFTANVCTVFNTLTRPDDEINIINESDVLFQVLSKIEIQPR